MHDFPLIARTKASPTYFRQSADRGTGSETLTPTVNVGDYVQWISGGVDQFKLPRKVIKIAGDFAWVFGSNVGMPMAQMTVVEPPAPKPVMEAGKATSIEPSDADDDQPNISVLLAGNRLQITADVDAAGLDTLKQMIGKYEEILKLLSPTKMK
jgi:hypothetical protein